MNTRKLTCLAIILILFFMAFFGLIVFLEAPIVSIVCSITLPIFGFKRMFLIRGGLTSLSLLMKFDRISSWFLMVEGIPDLTPLEIFKVKIILISTLYLMGWAYLAFFYLMFRKRKILIF